MLPGLTGCIALPASLAGSTPLTSPDGIAGQCGPGAHPASRTAQPERGKVRTTHGTFGRTGFGSSASAALQSSLANRLKQRLGTDGLMLFQQTWKRKVTPSGRVYWAHTASGLRTSDSGFSSWPSPKASNTTGAGTRGEGGENLQTLASWATPTTRDHKDGGSVGTAPVNGLLGRQVWLAGWATPKVATGAYQYSSGDHSKIVLNLEGQVRGVISSGSPAEMEKPGQLSPAFSLWLQGFPTAWASCGAQVIPLSRRRRLSSSPRGAR